MKRKYIWYYIALIAIIILGGAVRLWKVNEPLSDWFSWRQTDTAAVGKIYAEKGIDLLKPQYFDLSSIQSGKENPKGYRMVEFPIYNAAFAQLYRSFPQLSIEAWARIVAIVLSLGALWAIYAVLYEEAGFVGAVFGSLFFALAPYVIFYSRTILPDMPSVSLAMISVYFAYRYSKEKGILSIVFSLLFFALALLVKPTVVFYGIIHIYLLISSRKKTQIRTFLTPFIFLAIAALPLMWWRKYIQQYPEGIPANRWLFTSVNTPTGFHSVFLRPAFFRWIFFERINNLILGGYLTFFFLLGLFYSTRKTLLHIAAAAALFGYLFTFQGGNVQHDYYQIIITPALALIIGYGVQLFMDQRKFYVPAVRLVFTIIIMLASFAFSFYKVRPYYNQNSDRLLIADVVQSLTNKDDIIVVDALGDTTILYLANRYGYPAPYKDLDDFKKENNASYFITTNTGYKRELESKYKLIFQNDKVLVFEL